MRDNELAALKAENEQLRSRLDAVEGKLSPKPRPVAPPVEEGVRVTHPRTVSIAQPTIEEFKKLLKIVKAAHPSLVPDFHDRSTASEYGIGFVASFQIISDIKRTATLDRRDASHWAHNATLFLDARGDRAHVSAGAFMAAAIAAGDVAYAVGEYRCHVGLTYDGGAPATADSWRRVLSTGQVRPAIHVEPQHRVARPSQVQIYYG
jgi:hypothetical protein